MMEEEEIIEEEIIEKKTERYPLKNYVVTNFKSLLANKTIFVNKHPLLTFIVTIIIAIIVYFVPNPLNDYLFRVFNSTIVLGVNDTDIKNIIFKIISSFTILISVVSAIYVFTYREQKSIAPSASTDTKKNTLVIRIICLMIFLVVFGSMVVSKYSFFRATNPKINENTLIATKQLFSADLLLLIMIILLLYNVIKLFKYLFAGMSVDTMLKDSIEGTSKIIEEITNAHREDKKKYTNYIGSLYKQLHYSLESVFQNFKFVAENNMNKEFQENIELFKSEVINKLKSSDKRFNYIEKKHEQNLLYSYLVHSERDKFLPVYDSTLRSIFSLITSLMKNQQYSKAQDLVDLYFEMFIEEEQFVRVFQNNLAFYVDTLDTGDEKQISIFINSFNRLPASKTIFVHKYVIMKMITKNQLINLTNSLYVLKSFYEEQDFPIYKDQFIVILLQNLIKSIEISNYSITGFLIKFLVTNFEVLETNTALKKIKNNSNLHTTIWEETEESSEKKNIKGLREHTNYPIKINTETFDYCLKKAAILIYGQYIYSAEKKLWFTKTRTQNEKSIDLKMVFDDCDYSEYMYIVQKIESASEKYGLLFLKNDDVTNNIQKHLNFSQQKTTGVLGIIQSIAEGILKIKY